MYLLKEDRFNYHYKLLYITIYFLEGFTGYIIYVVLSYYLNNVLNLDPIIVGIYGSVPLIPFFLKIIIGPLIDNRKMPILKGRIRPYIIIGSILNAVFISFLGLNPQDFIVLYLSLWTLQSLGLVFMDVGTDILVIRDKDQRMVKVSSVIIVVGLTLGEIFSAIYSVVMIEILNVNYFLFYLYSGIICAFLIIFILFFREKEFEVPSDNPTLKELFQSLKSRNIIIGTIFGFLLYMDSGLLEYTLEDFLYNQWNVGLQSLAILNIVGTITVFISAPIIYILRKKANIKRVLILISCIFFVMYISLFTLLVSELLTFEIFLIIFCIGAIFSSINIIFYYAFFFEISEIKMAGIHFVFLTSFVSIGKIIGIFIGGYIYEWGGMVLIFIVCSIVMYARLFPLIFLKSKNQ